MQAGCSCILECSCGGAVKFPHISENIWARSIWSKSNKAWGWDNRLHALQVGGVYSSYSYTSYSSVVIYPTIVIFVLHGKLFIFTVNAFQSKTLSMW